MSNTIENYSVKDISIEHQYELPRRLYAYAKYYPNVSFIQALKLYELSVEETIVIFNANHLFDTPLSFGRGLVHARNKWLQKMREAEKAATNNNCDASAISKV